MGVNGVPQQLSGMIDRFTYLRTGTVLQVDPFFVTVLVGETQIRAAYVRESEPDIDALVAVMRQGASWFVVGTTSVSGGNAVQNPSFEQINEDNTPLFWTLWAISNQHSMQAVSSPGEAIPDPYEQGDNVLEVGPNDGTTGSAYVYSAAIGVVTGQVWELSAYYNAKYGSDNPDTLDVSIRALWFANATNLYPTTAAADTTVQMINNIPMNETMSLLRGNVTVPAGPAFMRVAVHIAAQAYTAGHFDFVTARRVS